MPAKKKTRSDGTGTIAAQIVIHRGADMTARGRRQIAGWIRREATFFERHADQMATRFVSSWRYGG